MAMTSSTSSMTPRSSSNLWKFFLIFSLFVAANVMFLSRLVHRLEIDSLNAFCDGKINGNGNGNGNDKGSAFETYNWIWWQCQPKAERVAAVAVAAATQTEAIAKVEPEPEPETILRKTQESKPSDPHPKDSPPSNNNENKSPPQNNSNNNSNNNNSNKKDPAEVNRVYIPRAPKRKRKREPKNDPNRTLSPEEKLQYTIPNTAPFSNVSNAVFYRDIPPEYLEPNPDRFLWDRGTDLVTNSKTRIPEWMKDYFRWHRYKRDTWNLTNWESERWLVSQCLADQDSKKCGGTADRLKPVPALLRKAWESKRIYLIRWTRPGLLEEFLIPPEGGFDWRVPEELARVMNDPSNGKRLATRTMINRYASTGLALVRSRFQTDTPNLHYHRWVFGEDNVTESDPNNVPATIDEPDFDSVFPSLWKIAFTPSPPIQTILRNKLNELGLVVNGYVGAHMRALYKVATRPEKQQKQFAENALACATELWPDPPLVFLASDSSLVLEHALGLSKSGRHGIPKVVTSAAATATAVASNNNNNNNNNDNNDNKKKAEQEQHPLHLDTFVAPIEEFYGTFVDLYLLAMARCVTYGTGGYGHWGMLIGGHTTCTKRQHRIGTRIKNPSQDLCHFPDSAATRVGPLDGVDPSDTVRIFGDDGELGPLLLPPMP